MISLTFANRNIGYNFKNLSKWFNSWITNIKAKLKRRENEILFYIKAIECQKDGTPHIHIMIKLNKPIELFQIPTRKGTYTRPFEQDLFKWKYGFYDVRGVKSNDTIGYILKYITKTIQRQTDHDTQTLAFTWISNKRMYSNTMFDLLKNRFPNLHNKIKNEYWFDIKNGKLKKFRDKVTVNNLVNEYWNGFTFPKINWNHNQNFKKRFGYITRFKADLLSDLILKYPIESRLNYEGFYQVTALRWIKPNSETGVRELDSPTHPKNFRERNLKIKIRLKKYNELKEKQETIKKLLKIT